MEVDRWEYKFNNNKIMAISMEASKKDSSTLTRQTFDSFRLAL